MTPALLPRSRKPVSLLIALAAALVGLALSAAPATALSLNPEAGSPGIGSFNDLHTILFVIVVLVVVGFNLWLLRAARARARHTGAPRRKAPSQAIVAAVLGVFALFIFVTATALSHKGREVPDSVATVAELEEGQPLAIRTTGQQWLWRFDYPNGAFSYHRLVVPTGVTVALGLRSIDVVHGWNVPSLTGKAQAVPGKTNTVYFRADEEGVHTGRSSVFSGQGYSTMQIEVEAVPPAEYERFIDQQKTDIQDAQDTVEKEIASN